MKKSVILVAVFTFVILLTVPAWAQNQDTQGAVQSIGACTVMDKPGSYALTRNITARQSDLKHIGNDSACILILADFVSLDLRGYTITGPGTGDHDGYGIMITTNAGGKSPIAAYVRNGCITNFNRGFDVDEDPVAGGLGHTVEGVRVAGNWAGIFLNGVGVRVKDVVAVSNGVGMYLWSGYGHSVEHCQVHSSGGEGIAMRWECYGSRIVGNTVSGNGTYGIYAQCPSLILQNMAFQNGWGDVVVLGSSCTTSDNNPAPVLGP